MFSRASKCKNKEATNRTNKKVTNKIDRTMDHGPNRSTTGRALFSPGVSIPMNRGRQGLRPGLIGGRHRRMCCVFVLPIALHSKQQSNNSNKTNCARDDKGINLPSCLLSFLNLCRAPSRNHLCRIFSVAPSPYSGSILLVQSKSSVCPTGIP